jgi:tetratricopeptide (TPR) repeat protein
LLEQRLDLPALLARPVRVEALYRLARLDIEDGRYESAAGRCREALPLAARAGQSARIRERLAQCLEALQRAEEAREQRGLAAKSLAEGRADAALRAEQGRAFEGQGDPLTAYEEYAAALSLLPGWRPQARAELELRMGLAALRAGQPAEAVRRCDCVLASRVPLDWRIAAHSLGAVACAALRRNEEGERHRSRALRIAEELGNDDLAGSILAASADAHRRQGRLLEAIETADRAAKVSLRARRRARWVEAESLAAMGRFDAARASLELAERAIPYPEPSLERISLALLRLARAELEIDAGRPDDALTALRAAAVELRREARTCLWHDCAMAQVLSLLDRRREAKALATGIEERLAPITGDPPTLQRCWAALARVHLQLGDPAAARTAVLKVLAGTPDPAARPTAFYHLGEAEVQLGDGQAAAAAFRAAAGSGATHRFARLAEQRLQELIAAPVSPPLAKGQLPGVPDDGDQTVEVGDQAH